MADAGPLYYSPATPDPQYPEIAHGIWRIETAVDSGGLQRQAVVAFDAPTPVQIVAPLQPDAFGLRHFDAQHFAYRIGSKSHNTGSETTPTHSYDELLDLVRDHGSAEPLLVTVSGMSGSGKSYLSKRLTADSGAMHLETDHFHIGATALRARDGDINHDLPTTYDYAEAAGLILRLLRGQEVHLPSYDYVISERRVETQHLDPGSNVIIAEGLYANRASQNLLELANIRTVDVLVHTPLYVCVLRRILRDALTSAGQAAERAVGFAPEETLAYLHTVAIPTYLKYATPAEQFDVVI